MPIIYMLHKQESTSKEPYQSFEKQFNLIKNDLDEKTIELAIGNDETGVFANGFYFDETVDPENILLSFYFKKIEYEELDGAKTKGFFIRMQYVFSFDYRGWLPLHLDRIKAIKQRVPFFYIPNAESLEFSSQMDDMAINLQNYDHSHCNDHMTYHLHLM